MKGMPMAEVEQLDCTNPNRLLALDDDESMLAWSGGWASRLDTT